MLRIGGWHRRYRLSISGRGLATAFLWLASIASVPAFAQEVAVATPGEDFRESYDESAPVSGGVVVGLRLGDTPGKLDPDNVRFAMTQKTLVCVRALTRDGRYSANNEYTITSTQTAKSVRIFPVTKIHAAALAGYDGRDYALKVFEAKGKDCIPENAVHFPQLGPRGNSDVLTIMINASSRRVSLEAPAGATDIVCGAPAGGARIAFDQECRVNIHGIQDEVARFVIAMDDGFDTEKEPVLVSLRRNR
ncbi:hypothetical protein NFO65_10895 [Neorhizobium galegae]|uniref:hypothetical protein n=1 Tax=Neorhizobium galegae TaxID=399 RepID=UPI0021010FD3|nr:hypothetical protein [Neorhizobium galegae]MCQ1571250.1 hypothetical protein [Neorhizobium galegae]